MRLFSLGSFLTVFAAAAALVHGQAPAPAPSERITVTGCVVRQTGDGAALSAHSEGPLTLTKAVVANVNRAQPVSAVPGSLPAGSDSGTIPQRPVSPTPQNVTPIPDKSYELLGSNAAALAKLIGQRVEIVGTVTREMTPARDVATAGENQRGVRSGGAGTRAETGTRDLAHPSAPKERLTVVSFRAIGGNCN